VIFRSRAYGVPISGVPSGPIAATHSITAGIILLLRMKKLCGDQGAFVTEAFAIESKEKFRKVATFHLGLECSAAFISASAHACLR